MKKHMITAFIAIVMALFINGTTATSERASAQEQEKRELTEQKIEQLSETFIHILQQETDENYLLTHHDTKTSLTEEFTKVATTEMAVPFVDFYFTETEEGVRLLPTETPAWFQVENDYAMINIDKATKKVIQDNQSDLHGSYTIELQFVYEDGWKISDAAYQ